MNQPTGNPTPYTPPPVFMPEGFPDQGQTTPSIPSSSLVPPTQPTPSVHQVTGIPQPILYVPQTSHPEYGATQRIPQIPVQESFGQPPTSPPQGFYFANTPPPSDLAFPGFPAGPTPDLSFPNTTNGASDSSYPQLIMPNGESRPLTANCTIGRTANNYIFLDDPKVSREHAHLLEVAGQFQIADNGSTNGTFLNEMKVVKPTNLRSGDRLRVGKDTMIFLHGPVSAEQSEGDGTDQLAVQGLPSAECWLLLANVVDTTSLLQTKGVEGYVNALGQWFEACRSTIQLRRGDINKSTSNGFLAYWRDDQRTRQAEMAATLQVLGALRSGNHPDFRLLVHVGQASMAINQQIGEQILKGQELHRLYQIEKMVGHPPLIDVIATAEAAARLKSFFVIKELGSHQIPGYFEPQNLFGLTRIPKEMQPPPQGR